MSARPNAAAALVLPAVAFVGSAAVAVYGAVSTASASQTLTAALTSGAPDAVVDVYGSQSAIVVSSGLLTAGIVGLVVSIALFGALIAFGAFSKADAEPELIEVDGELFDEAELDAEPAAEQPAEAPVADAAADEEPAAEASDAEKDAARA